MNHIMKKVILTFALLSLVVLTSFTTTETQTTPIQNTISHTGETGDGGNGQDLRGSNKKLDFAPITNTAKTVFYTSKLELTSNVLNTEFKKKSDI